MAMIAYGQVLVPFFVTGTLFSIFAIKMETGLTKYGVHAMNHNEMVIKATLANLHSALVFWASAERNEATFIFLACSRMFFSWAETACESDKMKRN